MNVKRTRAAAAAVLGLALVGAAGCGGEPDRAASTPSIVTPDLARTVLTDADVNRPGRGTVQAAFLRYWSLLQYQAWPDAVEMFDPSLVRAVGADTMVEGLKSQATYFQLTRPTVVSVYRRDGLTTVGYRVKDGSGKQVLRSVRFARRTGEWTIVYDAFLDSALRQSVQNATQASIDPNAAQPSRRAVAAGVAAGQLQSQWIASRLRAQAASRPRSAAADR